MFLLGDWLAPMLPPVETTMPHDAHMVSHPPESTNLPLHSGHFPVAENSS
jgi:hypothetical protein